MSEAPVSPVSPTGPVTPVRPWWPVGPITPVHKVQCVYNNVWITYLNTSVTRNDNDSSLTVQTCATSRSTTSTRSRSTHWSYRTCCSCPSWRPKPPYISRNSPRTSSSSISSCSSRTWRTCNVIHIVRISHTHLIYRRRRHHCHATEDCMDQIIHRDRQNEYRFMPLSIARDDKLYNHTVEILITAR